MLFNIVNNHFSEVAQVEAVAGRHEAGLRFPNVAEVGPHQLAAPDLVQDPLYPNEAAKVALPDHYRAVVSGRRVAASQARHLHERNVLQ